MGSFTKREQVVILVVVLIIVLALGFKFALKDIIEARSKTMEVENTISKINHEALEEIDTDREKGTIMVHVSGQVYLPGIVELDHGKRVVDAVELAGGLKKHADMDRINLAKKLVDEEKIYIPEIGEEIPAQIESFDNSGTGTNKDGKININTCSKEDLISLPGIGDVIAGRIIDYRQGSPFNKIEDIMNVSGIGDKKFQSIMDLIKVK